MTRRRSPRPGTAHPDQEASRTRQSAAGTDKDRRGARRMTEDIYAPPAPEEIERMLAELASGVDDEARRQARLEYNKKFPHRQMDVEYGLKPRPE